MQPFLPKSGSQSAVNQIGLNITRFILSRPAIWLTFSLGLLFGTEAVSQTTISSLGSNSGWYSDDTRNSSGTNLVGVVRTQYGKPGQPPTGADDIAIDQQLQFVGGPTGSTGGGTVKIIAPSNNAAKSTLSTVNLAGFAPASDLTGGGFSASYRWYMEPNPTVRTVAFRIGIQSTQWAASQASFTATRSGEQTWDLILVNLMDSPAANAWNDVNVDKDNGLWYVYGQAGNGNWVGIAGSAPPGGAMQKTLADWQADATWGPILFGAGAKITNVQFGLGSGQQLCNAYVDYLTTTILNSGNTINFAAPVRVYSDLAETMFVGGYATIQAAIDDATTLNGYFVRVDPGTYNENVTISKSLTLRSSGGKGVTTISGSTGLGSVIIQASNVTVGDIGQGFTIEGYDSPSPGLEYAAVYIQGARSNVTLRGNEIVADGEAGLLTEVGQAVNNLVVSGNVFSGKTFVGAEAGDCGFANQFTAPNVPRQLVVIQTGSGITFTSNQITGTAGSTSSVSGCETFGQGNTLITIDANNATIRGNTFAGTTARSGHSLRVRGTGANISCNTFDNAGLGLACVHIFFNTNAVNNLGSPNSLAGVAGANTFTNEGAYFTGAEQIYRSSAQVAAIPQTPIAANSVAFPQVTNVNTGEIYCSIQAAINDPLTLNGHTISVAAGTYNEDVNINKDLTLQGAGIDVTTVSGPIGGGGATFQVASPGVIIDGFTITRDGNNLTDWNNSGLNFAGIAIQGQANDAEIRNCKLIGNRTGIDINNSDGNNIHNNVITFNRSGLLFRNTTDNTILVENEITDNWTMGVLFLDASLGTNIPVQSALNCQFNNNNISGNWYGQIVDRQAGGSLPLPGTTNIKNFECNWYGTVSPVISTANSAEPGYPDLIPVAYGGSSTPPGGQPDICGPASANFDYLLYLVNGTDNDGGAAGFQPAPLSCTGGCPGGGSVVNANTSAIYCSIQAAINAASPGDVLNAAAGAYAENVVVNKSITLNGPNANTACGSRVTEALIAPPSGLPVSITADGVTVNGFEITAPLHGVAVELSNTNDVSVLYNNIHDIGNNPSFGGPPSNSNTVHSIRYQVGSGSYSEIDISNNCISNINHSGNTFNSASAVGILHSGSLGTLSDLTIAGNEISYVNSSDLDWTLGGRIAYGVSINVGGNSSFLTNGKVVGAEILNNEISNLSGFISTGIGLEGNTENAVVKNNSVSVLSGKKLAVRSGGGYDLSGLKFENNRYVSTVTVEDNSFQTNTFVNNGTPNLGYAISNYVPVADGGQATISCNWLGTATYSQIQDNPSLTGKIFNKDNCVTNFVPYLINGTDNSAAVGFQPQPAACKGGPVQVYNGATLVSGHALIQEAIDAGTTMDGYIVRISSATYLENVDAATGGKSLIFAPGASPGCVTVNGNFTLNAGDDLEMEIEGTTPCTQHDQLIVNGVVTLNNADLVLPASAFLAQPGDQIVIIDNDGTDPIVGAFAQGNFATDGNNYYYINYEGGTGNDVVLTKCCGGLLDLGIFNHVAASPAGNKLQVRVRPNMDVINGAYTSGIFAIRTTQAAVTFTKLSSPLTPGTGYSQIATGSDAGYNYFVFYYEDPIPDPVNWLENTEYELITLGYDCSIGNATFELTSDAYAVSLGAAFYQELGAQEAQGTFYQATATSPAALSITASNNGPVICETMPIDLSQLTSFGTSPYTYVWSGPNGYASTDADPAPFAAVLASAGTYYVTVTDANGCTATASTTVIVPASGACVLNVNTTLLYPTITQAIDATPTLDGHTLQVPAGTWTENAIVDKELTILGPNAAIDPCSGVRVPEAIVVPATAAISSGEIFHVAADNVTISGFTIDGDNTLLNSGFSSTNGADIDAAEGITVYETGINNLTVTNNILQNLSYFGVTLYDYPAGVPSSGHLISNNKFQNFGTYDAGSGIAFWGGGVLLYNNQYARVVNNCMTNVRIGVQTGNFSQANPGAATFQVIDNNTIQARRRGIFHNLAYSNASAYTLSNNTITGLLHASETVWDGILLSSLSVPSTSSGNTINGAGITNPSEGYEVWNVKNTSPAVISGGSVSNVNTGLFLNNYEGYSSDGTDGAHATVSGLSISPNAAGTGIRLHDNPLSTGANVQLTIGAGITVTGGTKGLVIERPSASIVGGTLNDLSFTGTTGNYIELWNNAGNLDALTVTFDGTTGAAKTLAQNFATEDKIIHKIDDGALGFVLVKANHDFVTVNSFINPATTIASIQRGVDAASNGFTVNVANGSYTDNVLVNKEVRILGESQAGTIVYPLISGPNPCVGASLCPGASNVFLVQANNVSIEQLTVDGDNTALTSGLVVGGADLDARNGIITNHSAGTFNNLLVDQVTVKNIYLRGIYASSGGTFTFSNNTVNNVQGEANSIAMMNFGGSGAFTNNTVSDVNDGIVSNWSKGSTYTGNTVTNAGSGIHTDNNSAGTGDIIQNNTVSNSTYGIFVYSPYHQVHVRENTITNTDVGFANAGSYQAGGVTTLFYQNTIDGMNKPNSTGIYQTTEIWGYASGNTSGDYYNNFIQNVVDAFYLDYETGFTNAIAVNDNSITGTTNGVVPGTLTTGTLTEDFTCNWWGSATAATVAAEAAASANFTPWLVNGTDDAPATAGFQPVAGACNGTPVVITLITPDHVICGETTGSLTVTFSGGTGPYDIAWTGGSANGVISPYTITPLLPGVYGITVTDSYLSTATTTASVLYQPVTNQTQSTYHETIQDAIDAALAGDVIVACEGAYSENIIVDVAITLNGANSGTPCDGVRGPESILSGTTTITIASNGVTIDGFQIEGITCVSSTGFTKASIINNKLNALEIGIASSLIATTGTDGYTIQDNCIDFPAQTYDVQAFASNPVLSASQAPGTWYTDRYEPFGFVSALFDGDTRLKHSIDASACQSCRPPSYSSAFYNTQGRKYDIAGSTAMSIDLYIPSDWATTGRRMAGFWGTGFDNSNAISSYPILEFTSDGANPRFRAYDVIGGNWLDMGLPTGFAYNEWYTLEIVLNPAEDALIYAVGDLNLVWPANGTTTLGNVILQGHNTDTPGVTYDIYWDNFQSYGSPEAENAPTVGIALAGASGTDDVVVQDNNISDAFYGYVLSGVVTTPRTTVRGGAYTNLMQGVAVVNTLDGATYLPSTVGVEDLSFTSFGGNYPALPDFNFHSGVYAFTGGSNPAAVVDILVEDVTVSNTGNIAPNCAGIHFADFSTGAGIRLNAEVQRADVLDNKNRGVQVRGENALAVVANSEIRRNGGDPYGTGGNDGFGVFASNGADVRLDSNYIQNPATQVGYTVTAMFIAVTGPGAPPPGKITAYHNHIDRNGNGELTSNTYPISQFMATCNWWGDDDIDVVDGLVDGNVTFVPYLNDDTDLAPATKGFQPLSTACVNPTRWYVNDNALTDDVFTLGLGDDNNQGTKIRPFRTIGKAVMVIASADSIYIDAGTYNEQVVLPNTREDVHFIGVGPCGTVAPALTTVVDFTGTVTGKPTLFDIAGNGTVIDGIQFKVDLAKLNSAIIATDAGLDSITIRNNCIDPYRTGTYFGSYGTRNAISLNYGSYRINSTNPGFLLTGNTITYNFNGTPGDATDDAGFRAGLATDEGTGTATGNTIQTINQDLEVRFSGPGNIVVSNNNINGGGVELSEYNSGTGTVTVTGNTFNGAFGSTFTSALRLKNNINDKETLVQNNAFSGHNWGLSLENYRTVTVDDNTFTPDAASTTFRHITVNTKLINSSSATITQIPIDGVFTNNTFNSNSPTVGGTAMAFYNHDSDNDSYGAFTVGTAGNENIFAKHLTWAVYLGDQQGPTNPAPPGFPEYGGSIGNTIMDCWAEDIDIQSNTFDVDLGSGQQLPSVMNHAERLELEDILYHLPDNSCLGELIYYTPVVVDAKVFLQGPYDSVSNLMKDDLRAGNLVPVSEPYSVINTANPGSFVEVNNFVTETVAPAVFTVTGADAIVDWIWLELRDKNNFNTVVATRAALVQRDGDIVDLDGTSNVLFPDSYIGEYYLLVRHRNHLGAMTAAAVNFTPVPPFIDFTTAAQATYGTTSTSARRLIETATYGLWAGNTVPKSSGGFEIMYNGSGNDRLPILAVVGAPLNVVPNVYKLEDVNMNGEVKYNGSGNDRVIILGNVGPSTPLNVITQQPNN